MEGVKDTWLQFFDQIAVPIAGQQPLIAYRMLDKIPTQAAPPVPVHFSVGLTVAVSTTQHVYTGGAVAAAQSLYLVYSQ
jgi:hypothetical protein